MLEGARRADFTRTVTAVPQTQRVRKQIVVSLIAVVLLGAGVWVALDELTSSPTVAVVGDSITALSRQWIAVSLFDAGHLSTIDAAPGITMAQAEPAITQLAHQHPSAWIIELGTNDALGKNPLWGEPILAEWQQVRSSQCVIYVSVSPRSGPIAAQIDTALAGLAHEQANVHVLDWGNLEYANPAWLEPDKIHPTPAGQAELGSLEAQEVHRYC
jgi:lysophospholipase L1-like esterase